MERIHKSFKLRMYGFSWSVIQHLLRLPVIWHLLSLSHYLSVLLLFHYLSPFAAVPSLVTCCRCSVTCYLLPLFRHLSPVAAIPSLVTCYRCSVNCHLFCSCSVTCYLLPLFRQLSPVAAVPSLVTCCHYWHLVPRVAAVNKRSLSYSNQCLYGIDATPMRLRCDWHT